MAKWCYGIKLYRRKSTAQDVQIQQRGNHDELLQDLVDLTTNSEGILGMLEQPKVLDHYQSKVLLCTTLQVYITVNPNIILAFILFSKYCALHRK